MEINLPLEKMTTEDKIKTMETIWDDLCKRADSISSPSWHEKVLLDREEGIKNGNNEFVDWDKAKKNIQDKIK